MDPKHEHTTNEALPKRHSPKKSDSPDPRAEMKIRKPEEDVLDVIESVESQLGALRKAHEEHRRAMQSLNEQKSELNAQVAEIENREQELTTREVELAEMRQEFEQREMDLVQRASGLEQRESKMETHAENLEQREAELESRDAEIQRRIAELDKQLSGISKRKQELDSLESEVLEKLAREETAAKQLEQSIAELEHLRSQLGEQDSQITELNATVADLTEKYEERSAELKSAMSKLRGREIELGERSKALEELAEKSGNVEQELSEAREAYEKQLTQAQGSLAEALEKLEREQKVSEGLRAQVESLEQENAGNAETQSQLKAIREQLTQREQELEDANAKLASMRSEADSQSGESQELIQRLQKELNAAKAKVDKLNAQLASIGADTDEELTRQREKSIELEQQSKQLVSELESLKGELEKANTERASLETAQEALRTERDELQSKLDSTPDEDSEQSVAYQKQLEEAADREKELGAKLEERESQLKQLAERVVSLESEIAEAGEGGGKPDEQAQAKITALENQSSELIATIEKLNSQLEAERAKPREHSGTANDEWSQRRRERLGRMRKRLHADAEKVRLATDALQSRYEQCEQVLTKRAELAEAYEAIASAQRKVRNKEVRSGVFIGLFALAAITLMLGVGSWFTAGRVAPGMYSSRATLTATAPEGKLAESDLADWESYITGLITEPRFLEVAADRMKRRGISEFSTPGELGKHMDESLDIVASMPGEIVVEYRGVGAERAQRILDTFVVAISGAANNARPRRGDIAITNVQEGASLTTEPLDTKRLEMAGMIFGGAMALAMIVGGVLWRRLAAAKAKFENDSRVQVLYDEEQWQVPT